jgi:hypothetical protein
VLSQEYVDGCKDYCVLFAKGCVSLPRWSLLIESKARYVIELVCPLKHIKQN